MQIERERNGGAAVRAGTGLRAAVSVALAGAAAGVPVLGFAQPPADGRGNYVEEVVVSATRTEVPISRTGSSVTVIGSAELERQNVVRVFDVLDQVPGVSTANSESVAPRVHIRGAPFQHTLVLIDGVRMTMPSFRRSEIINAVTPDNIERVEVLRGPQSTLYGGDAAAGVINIITKRGEGPPTGSTSVELGSWSTRKLTGTARGSVERFDYSVEGSVFRSDWFSVGDPNGERDERRHKAASARLGYALAPALRLEGMARWVETHREDDNFEVDADRHYEETDYATRLQLVHEPADGRWQNVLGLSRSGSLSQGFEHGIARETERDQRIIQIDYQADVELRPDHVLTFGVERNEQSVTGGIFEAINPDDITNSAVFAQFQGAKNRFLYTVGARRDDNSDFGGFSTYKATAVYFLNDVTRLKGNIGSGFATPSMAQLTGTSACPNGNAALQPEENTAAELGIERRFPGAPLGQVRLEVNVFRNEITNIIVGSSCVGSPPLENKDRRNARGAEIMVGWTPLSGLALAANFSVVDAEDIADTGVQRAEGLPRRTANFSVRYDLGRTSLTGNVTYNGDRLDPPVTLDSFTLVNFSAEIRLSDAWTLFGRVENLLDEDYQTTRRAQTADRNMHVGLRRQF